MGISGTAHAPDMAVPELPFLLRSPFEFEIFFKGVKMFGLKCHETLS
jgi:hypothetical protein